MSWASNACPSQCIDNNPSGRETFFLGPQTEYGTYCCQGIYDTANNRCSVGVPEPFDLPPSYVMDRLNGRAAEAVTATEPPIAYTATVTVTATASVTESNTAKEVGVGVGVAIPLLLALLSVLWLLWRERRKGRQLKTQMEASSSKSHGESGYEAPFPARQDLTGQRDSAHMVSAEETERKELPGWQRTAELGDRTPSELQSGR
ncbi:hypothetical protein LTR37_012106 [Vermiconidia calcicola]|uniref:Uncharacterized protein n=1 Tax=Vermiconidia calcicola TaxID=1690605 RepID=A0ACC3N076_9PEZI|nr:hypothetical protein LTR37_012106 [Vermiconidia calcicola]